MPCTGKYYTVWRHCTTTSTPYIHTNIDGNAKTVPMLCYQLHSYDSLWSANRMSSSELPNATTQLSVGVTHFLIVAHANSEPLFCPDRVAASLHEMGGRLRITLALIAMIGNPITILVTATILIQVVNRFNLDDFNALRYCVIELAVLPLNF